MKGLAIVCGVTVLALVGCQSKPKTTQVAPMTPSYVEAPITDVAPMPPVAAYDPAAVTSTPVVEPVAADATAPGQYTVQRGDTLYGIARRSYGDGKQWKKIAAANPGVSPQSLKVGQKLQIP